MHGRLAPHHEADLRWFFCESDGSLGLHSSFESMVERMQLAGAQMSVQVVHDVSDRLLEMAMRARQISRGLEAMQSDRAKVLKLVYGPLGSPALFPEFSLLAGIAARTHASQKLVRGLGSPEDALLRVALKARTDLTARHSIHLVRLEAEQMLRVASEDYLVHRQHAPRLRVVR